MMPMHWSPLLHHLRAAHLGGQGAHRPPQVRDLPWDALLRVVFTRAAEDAGVPCRSMTDDVLTGILEQLRIHTLEKFAEAMLQLHDQPEQGAALRRTVRLGMSCSALRVLNRPGAWLLDTVHTAQMVLDGSVPQAAIYRVLTNVQLSKLMFYVFASRMRDMSHGANPNNCGNRMEHMCWLLLEQDQCGLILGLAYHARKI